MVYRSREAAICNFLTADDRRPTAVAAISNRAFSSGVRTGLGNRGYIRDFGKIPPLRFRAFG
jgi:hypothetical protein